MSHFLENVYYDNNNGEMFVRMDATKIISITLFAAEAAPSQGIKSADTGSLTKGEVNG